MHVDEDRQCCLEELWFRLWKSYSFNRRRNMNLFALVAKNQRTVKTAKINAEMFSVQTRIRNESILFA